MPPLIVDIRRNSLDDGPGVRSTVFFKGCVLDCVWCQNPETISAKLELQYNAQNCLGCGDCAEACPNQALEFTDRRIHDRERCLLCVTCVDTCPAGAVRAVGREYGVDELVARLMRDEPFYRHSGGGVTFSGGEPTIHLDYVAAVAAELQRSGVHTLLQTCGLYKASAVEERLLPHIDMVYFDSKIGESERHRKYCGVDNEIILANLARLAELMPDRVLPRVPLIPTITDGDSNLAAIATILTELGFTRVALLAYNPLWTQKRAELGLDFKYKHDKFMSDDEVARCHRVMIEHGLEVV